MGADEWNQVFYMDMGVKVAAARVRTYNKFEGETENIVGELCETVPVVGTTTAMNSNTPVSTEAMLLSFLTLIDRKPISASEKILYLEGYLAGEARKAVEGFFYRSSEDAYAGAWAVLKDRYGNHLLYRKLFETRSLSGLKLVPMIR